MKERLFIKKPPGFGGSIMMDRTEKSAYRNSWIADKLDRINLTMPKGKKETVKEFATRAGMSLNAYINQAVDERMERDSEQGQAEGN